MNNSEGNHGEDVKEYYYYLDAAPSHSYLKMLYKYPQREFPYGLLVEQNARRGLRDNEYELIDTGVFHGDRYWDVFVEYFKSESGGHSRGNHNRQPRTRGGELHVLPQLWFRNTWSWAGTDAKPSLTAEADGPITARDTVLGVYHLYAETNHELLFCDNETNVNRLYGSKSQGCFKDAFHE